MHRDIAVIIVIIIMWIIVFKNAISKVYSKVGVAGI